MDGFVWGEGSGVGGRSDEEEGVGEEGGRGRDAACVEGVAGGTGEVSDSEVEMSC